jgi:hypothetical protein
MSNKPIGNNFIEGPLGVVNVTFNGVALGKTIDDANIEVIEDRKDIKYAQNGTQPYDYIPTGMLYRVTLKLGEIAWSKLKQLTRGIVNVPGSNSAKLGRDIYRSLRDNFAKELKLYRIDSDGVSSASPLYRLTFFLAIPYLNGSLGAFGPDGQRGADVTFDCVYDETVGHESFGYSGYASSLGIS